MLDWFRHDEELRGSVGVVAPAIRDGQMGGLYDALVVTVGSGGTAVALTRSLSAWLTHRRSDVKITIRRADGMKLELDAKRVKSADVLEEVQRLLDQPPTEQ
ncbi:effector-associated constant component EACC1 [Nocardia xishanensis]